jgi:uncharacterized protein (TIGR02646 family)
MRKVHKNGNEPNELQHRRLSEAPFGWSELNDDPDLKTEIKNALVEEQGGLCAYTGIEIELDSCHIEHLRPRACWDDGSEVEYTNMVACFPRSPGDHSENFGATAKDRRSNWPCTEEEWNQFITPLDDRCEHCFVYKTDGSISADDDNQSAEETIRQLRLHDSELEDRRKQAVDGFLERFSDMDRDALRPAIKKKVEQLEGQYRRRQPGRLSPFIFVIAKAIRHHFL